MDVYAHNVILGIRDYYGDLLFNYPKDLTILERLSRLSNRLWEAFTQDNDCILNEINNYHPAFIGQSWNEIRDNEFSRSDAEITIARQYGYASFAEIPDIKIDALFERSVDVMLSGRLDELKHLIEDDPKLINQKSNYGHGASLIHYLGNNGVELYRQVVPYQLADILEYLLNRGADPNSTMNVYGGEFTMIALFSSSIHPKEAGIDKEVMERYARIVQQS